MTQPLSGRGQRHAPPVFLTGPTAFALAKHLGVEGEWLEELVMMHYYTVGLILYGYDEEERVAAAEYAGKFMREAVAAYNKRLEDTRR